MKLESHFKLQSKNSRCRRTLRRIKIQGQVYRISKILTMCVENCAFVSILLIDGNAKAQGTFNWTAKMIAMVKGSNRG